MFRILVLCAVVALVRGYPGASPRMCEVQTITDAGTGNYNSVVSVTPPTDYTSVTMELYFDNPIGNVNMQGGNVVKVDDTHITMTNEDSGSAGVTVEYGLSVQYSGKQPLLGAVTFNGENVCGTGGGFTTHPPLPNPCAESGASPYDYPQLLCMSILFYEAQRSGALPPDQRITWRWDSAMGDGQDVGHDLTGGYYDAGDHVKFGLPMAYTGTVLAWGLIEYQAGFEAAGELDNGKAAVQWVSDYLLKAHTATGELYGQVGDGNLDHNYWGRPEEMTMERPSEKIDTANPGSELAGESSAALAAASIVFADDAAYSADCLEAARDLYTLANDYRATYTDSITGAAGFYNSYSGYGDEITWAALWLYKATGEQEYLTAAKDHWNEFNLNSDALQFSWDDKKPGIFVLLSEMDGGSEYTTLLQDFLVDTMNSRTYTPEGLLYLDTWGALRHAMNIAFIANRAADLGIQTEELRSWAQGQLHYVLGTTGRSFIVGYGENPPQRPHHRSSSCPQYPTSCSDQWAQNNEGPNPHVLYGAMVGGPGQDDSYVDDRMDYVHNEVACDYNAALVGVLAAAVQNALVDQ